MTVRIGFVAVIRPLFKGDSPSAAERSRRELERLGEDLGFEVVVADVPGGADHGASGVPLPSFAVHDRAGASTAAARLADLDLDLLLVQHTTFATGEILAPLLQTPLPVALWALPESAGGRGSSGPLPLNSICGLNMTLSFAHRSPVDRVRPVKWLYGEADSLWFRQRLEPTLVAMRALRALNGARILQIGGTAPDFYGLQEAPALPGVGVEHMELEELFERVGNVHPSEARQLVREWQQQEPADVSEEQLRRSAALEIALARILQDGSHDALALRCWPELADRCSTMACAALGRLGDGCLPAACEGDVMGALSMLALQGASGEGSMLMDLSDLDDEGVLFWHCGNAPLSWASRSGSRLRTHFNRDGVGTVRDMVVRRGPATGFRLLAGGEQALLFSGRFEGAPDDLSDDGRQPSTDHDGGYDGSRGWLRELSWNGSPVSPREFLAGVLDHRVPHHFAFGSGELGEGLQELCGWLGSRPLPLLPPGNVLR